MTAARAIGLDDFVPLQIHIWGYAITGEVCEFSALAAEEHPLERHWDKTARDLAGQMVGHADEPYRRVRDWAALPWAAEYVLRGHAEWPGL